MILAVAVLVILSVFVMPMFDEMFETFDSELPPITQAVLDVSNFMRANYLFVLGGIVGFVLLIMGLSLLKGFKRLMHKAKLTIPVLKQVEVAILTARFTSSFATLLSSGVPLIDAMHTMGRLIGNIVVSERLGVVESEIKRGQNVAKSIETIDTFPPMLTEMIGIGERTGSLEEILETVSAYYDDQVQYSIKKATAAIEPIMIILIAIMVIIVLLAVFQPMLGLMDAIEKSGEVAGV